LNQQRVIGLDVFRSIAILSVLACHGIVQATKLPSLRAFASCLGFFGVEQFFVLSGFLIGSILIRDFLRNGASFSTLRNFWIRRWYRTLPNYYAYLLLGILFAAPWRHHVVGLALYPFFLQNFAWDMPDFFVASWSLSIEEWFYLLFPFSILLIYQVIKKINISVVASIVLFLLLPFFSRAIISGPRTWATGVHVVVVYRLDAIAIGVVLAYLRCNYASLWSQLCSYKVLIFGAVAATAVFFVMLKAGYGDENTGMRRGIDNAVTYEIVDLCFAFMLPWFSTLASIFRPFGVFFTWLSILSYSLYLSNWILVKPLGAIWFLLLPYSPGRFVAICTWLFLVFFVSALSYFFIERPFLLRRDARTISSGGNLSPLRK
jgi:peptidoglycan/LPS O-acetylase OafA/YrhL